MKICVILTNNYNKTNCENHLESTHPDLFSLLKKENAVKTAKPLFNQATLVDSCSVSNASHNKQIMNNTTDVLDEIKKLLYLFFNSCNIAIRQSRNVHLKELLNVLVLKGSVLKNVTSKIYFTRYSYKKEEKKMFSSIVTHIMESVKRSRDFYKSVTGNEEVAFLNVSHDGWDSKRHDILGACIHYVCPVTWCSMSVPIGLKRITDGKSSQKLAHQLNIILQRYGINFVYLLQ